MQQVTAVGFAAAWRKSTATIGLLLAAAALVPSASVPARAPTPMPAPVTPGANKMPDVSADRLWDAQTGLLSKSIDALQPRVSGRANLYAVAVAAAGRQQLFSREAHLALDVAAARFGAGYRGGLLLSNGAPDIMQAPLATRGNVITAMDGLGKRADPDQDILFVYLASHGGRDASLETDLPDLSDFRAISATSTAEALAQSRIRRRIIVISACFSGSWIPALANDDTIVITAARADRTSFGCDDTRRLTYFGQAFLEGPLAKGASLREAFEAARQTVSGWEAKGRLLPSEPQVFVGRNMEALWAERGALAPQP